MSDTTPAPAPSLVSYVGRSWATIHGRREVAGFATKMDGTRALAVTGGHMPKGSHCILTPTEVEQDMLVDAANLEAKRKSDAAAAERAAVAAAELTAFEAVAGGYLATIPAGIARARASAFLMQRKYGNIFGESCYTTRAEAISLAVQRGCTVVFTPHPSLSGWWLRKPDGGMFQTSKSEAGLARFLIAAAAAPQEAP